jgi:hypothetical protein
MEFTDRCTKEFARFNGWAPTDRQFTFDQLAGRAKTIDYKAFHTATPICYGADEVLDHLLWFRRERKPIAVVSMPYHGDRERAQRLAAQYGLIMLAPPIANAGWWLPGKNGTECFVFMRQGAEVRWMLGQEDESCYEIFVARFNQERHEAFERQKAIDAAKQPGEKDKLLRALFPKLPATTKVTEKMIDERLKDFVDKPELVGNEILTLRMSKEDGQCVYWMERAARQ